MYSTRVALIVLVLAAMMALNGCTSTDSATPGVSPLSTPDSPIVTPSQPQPLALPSPAPGLGVVGGTVIDRRTGQAPLEAVVYLGSIITMDSGLPIVRLDPGSAPVAIPQPNGSFVIQDIPPGEYGFLVYTPDFSFLVEAQSGPGSLIFTVEPDQVLDLGVISVDMP